MTTSVPQLVEPFRALRYADRDRLSQLISPPYDVITDEMRSELAVRDSRNIVHLILPRGEPNRYEHAASLLEGWRADGTMVLDPEPSVTVIQQRFTTPDGARRTRMGLLAALWAEPYSTGRIRPHERTHAGPKEDRLRLMRATKTAVEPLFFFARDGLGQLRAFLNDVPTRVPSAEAILDGVEIRTWRLSAEETGSTLRGLSDETLYIADGHHRFETSVAFREEHPSATAVIGCIVAVDDPGLVVLPTHRLVRGALPLAPEALQRAGVHLLTRPSGSECCRVVFPGGGEFWCEVPEAVDGQGATHRLTIARIERHIVEPLLRAGGTGATLAYTADEADAVSQVTSGAVAVIVPPTPVNDVLAIADEGGYMPPKSTYFFPKMPSGLVLMPFF